MDRRRFLQLVTGAGVSTATMTEAGFFAEFWQWLTKRPKHFIPPPKRIIPDPLMTYDPLQMEVHEIAADQTVPELAGMAGPQQMATIYYERRALENLKSNFRMWEGTQTPKLATSQMEVINHIQNHGWDSVKVNWKR